MSKKRAEAEFSNGEQTTEGSDPVSQQQDIDAKRAKLVSLSDTTLQDLPFELLECILVKVVAMEVKDMKLAKIVWKEKADLVIDRLRTVCSQWSSICATDFFRNEIHRTLDKTAQETYRLEMLHQYPLQFPVIEMTSLKDEIFILCKPDGEDYAINVIDRNNMAEVKDVIPLPRIRPVQIAGCSVSNCVYVLNVELELSSKSDSVLRITRAKEQKSKISPWITDLKLPLLTMSVSANGSLITLSKEQGPSPTMIVSIYAANGSLGHQIELCPDIFPSKPSKYHRSATNAIQKSNGNLVLVSVESISETLVTEIDTFGSVVRRYESALSGYIGVNFVDICDRILISNWHNEFELLDSEFNLLDFIGPQPREGQFFRPSKLHFNGERNEISFTYSNLFHTTFGLAIFRFISE